MKIILRTTTLCLSVWLLSSCHTVHPTKQTSIEEINSDLTSSIADNKKMMAKNGRRVPSSVNQALMPSLDEYMQPAKAAPARFDVTANNVPARDFFMGLVAGTSTNMLVHPSINGNITLNLKNVTLQEALDAAKDSYGYDYQQTSYGYEVLPPELETQLFHINYLDVQRKGRSYTQLTTGQVSNKVGTVTVGGSNNTTTSVPTATNIPDSGLGTISSIETRSEMEFWSTIEKSVQSMIGKGEGHSVTVNAQAGIIAVRAYPDELHTIARYINHLQSSLNRQVILEAKIVEVQLDDSFQAGIDWSLLQNPTLTDPNTGLPETGAGVGQGGNSPFANTDLKALTGIFAIRINGNFTTLINLLQTQGNVQVLSSPHISTVNNQKAVIKVGQDEFFVTGVSTSNTIVGTNTIPSQDVSLTPFFSGITLDVTPEISSDDNIVLHIHPSVSRVTEQTKVIGLGATSSGTANNLTLPLAFSTIRESDNIVRAKNGQVIVIGGLMQNNMNEVVVGTPVLSKIPFIGALFRRTSQVSNKSELVILLKPIIASTQSYTKALENEKTNFQILRRPFHAGGLPHVFGNEGEREDN